MDIFFQDSIIPATIILIAIIGYLLRKVDRSGGLSGIIVALIIWKGVGMEGLVSLFLFFIFGTYATSWKSDVKSKKLVSQENKGKRTISNVLGNTGVAAILSVFAIVFDEYKPVLIVMVIASFATACSDTLSSELGNVYGKKFFNIIALKPSQQGLDGVISTNGLLFGFIGSFLIAASMYFFSYGYNMIVAVTISGFLGNITDSVLGATLQQKGYLNNHMVNFFAILSGAAIALIFLLLIE